MYTFHMTEVNGIAFSIGTVEVCGYGSGKSQASMYGAADRLASGLNPDMEAYGTFSFFGGFPVGVFDSIGVIVRGKDANGAPLEFIGYTTF